MFKVGDIVRAYSGLRCSIVGSEFALKQIKDQNTDSVFIKVSEIPRYRLRVVRIDGFMNSRSQIDIKLLFIEGPYKGLVIELFHSRFYLEKKRVKVNTRRGKDV